MTPKARTRIGAAIWLAGLIVLILGSIVWAEDTPRVKIPPALWCQNYKSGSCVHASAVMLWRWQGQYEWADYWKRKYGNEEYAQRFHERCKQEGVTFCDTFLQRDVGFLEWAVRTRRGCMVRITNGPLYGYGGRFDHMVCLVHLDAKVAGILDNNDTGQGPGVIKWVNREAFLRDWLQMSWAWAPVSTPPAPPIPVYKKP